MPLLHYGILVGVWFFVWCCFVCVYVYLFFGVMVNCWSEISVRWVGVFKLWVKVSSILAIYIVMHLIHFQIFSYTKHDDQVSCAGWPKLAAWVFWALSCFRISPVVWYCGRKMVIINIFFTHTSRIAWSLLQHDQQYNSLIKLNLASFLGWLLAEIEEPRLIGLYLNFFLLSSKC